MSTVALQCKEGAYDMDSQSPNRVRMGSPIVGRRGGSDWMRVQHKVSEPEAGEDDIHMGWGRGRYGSLVTTGGMVQIRKFTNDNKIQVSHCWRRELQIFKRKS